MAISQFYKDNSIEKTFSNPVKTPFTFKCTDNLNTLFNSDFDDSIAISSNELPFYHNYQYGTEFQFLSTYTSGMQLTQNSNFIKLKTLTTKICLLYHETNIDSQYTDDLTNWYLYDNNNKKQAYNNLYGFEGFKLVTEFPFDRLVCSVSFADRKYNSSTSFSYFDDYTGDNIFNKAIIHLYYVNDDYTLTDISGYFVLAEIIKTSDNTIVSMLSFKNLLGEQRYISSNITVAQKYTDNCSHIDNNYFLHAVTSDIFRDNNNIQYYEPNGENTGIWNVFQYVGGYRVDYNVCVNKQLALNICSSIGLRFVTCNPSLINNKSSYNHYIKLAYMDDSGYVDYNTILNGHEEIENSNTHNKTIDLYNSPDIPDTPKPYPSKDDKIEEPTYRVTNVIGGFTRYYKVTRDQLASIISNINTATDIPDGYEFLPHVVSVHQYPFNVSQYATGHNENITIGGYDTHVTGVNLDSTQLAVQNIATIPIPRKYNNFLDKSPFTQISLYIPFCGWIDLPDIVVGQTITVDIAHDVINGSCIGIVKLKGMPIVQVSGVMGTNISISATEVGLKNAATTQAMYNVGGGLLTTGYALSTANPVGAVSGIMSTLASVTQGNIANNSNYTHQIGSTESKANEHISNTCYLRISFPVVEIPENFSHTYGFVCNQKHKVSECSGFTQCDHVDTSGLTCTQTEKEMIKSILESGFYK